jgi:glycosyltransferase involved in cell wall biosynthesis
MEVSIVICTANRARDLHDTIASLSDVRLPGPTELIVVDNRSTDGTRSVVDEATRWMPFPVRYLFESEDGKYAALNSGIRAASGRVILTTDDDVRFEEDWVERAVDGLSRYGCDFVGGRVLPVWGRTKPAWLTPATCGLHAEVIALLDNGPNVGEFGSGVSWPLSVNVAFRREVFDRVGLFDNRFGRKSGTLRSQAQREWHLRARQLGVRGFYLPNMVVHHLVKGERLTKQYFRRWLYRQGISRAVLFRQGGFDMEEPESERSRHERVPQVGGVPLPLIAKAGRSLSCALWQSITGHARTAFENELWLCFFAGVVRQRWADRSAYDARSSAVTTKARA